MEKQVGRIVKFFPNISVAVLGPAEKMSVGDRILIRGSSEVEQTVDSMQINHQNVESVKAGEEFGMKTLGPVKKGDIVYRIEEES